MALAALAPLLADPVRSAQPLDLARPPPSSKARWSGWPLRRLARLRLPLKRPSTLALLRDPASARNRTLASAHRPNNPVLVHRPHPTSVSSGRHKPRSQTSVEASSGRPRSRRHNRTSVEASLERPRSRRHNRTSVEASLERLRSRRHNRTSVEASLARLLSNMRRSRTLAEVSSERLPSNMRRNPTLAEASLARLRSSSNSKGSADLLKAIPTAAALSPGTVRHPKVPVLAHPWAALP